MAQPGTRPGGAQGADARHAAARPDLAADLAWPQGRDQRDLAIDLAWLVFLLGAIGLTPPLGIGRLPAYVWFPADLAALIALWLRPGPFLLLARRNMTLLAWPVLAIASTIWSIAPGLTLYHGLQLMMTMLVGILLSLHAGLFRVLQLYFVALLIAAVLSFVFVVISPGTAIFHTGEWQGLFNHKNSLGGAMGTLMTIGVCLFLQGWRRGFTAAATVFGAGMLAMSRSGAALVTVAIAMSMIIPVLIYRQGYSAFFFAVGALLAVGAAAMLYVDAARIDVMDAVLESLGKDATLTGRTVLWDFGVEAFEERPLLGWGYHAWWEASGPAVETLRVVIKQELWMFHNNFLEVAVAFGILGPVALGAALLFVLVTSVRTFLADPQYVNAWPMFFLVLVLVQAMAENPLFNNHGLNEVLLVAIASSAVRRKALEGAPTPQHEPQPAPPRSTALARS